MREIVLDTETTGLDPASGHRVLEIGGVELVNKVRTGKTFHVLINPERDVPDEAVRVHGHTAAALQNHPNFAGIVDRFLDFMGDAQIVIHNAEFDVRFLNAELGRLQRSPLDPIRIIDTLALARKRHPGQANSLDALCDRYRIDRSRRVRHGALLDAEILVEVYSELTGGRQASLVFQAQPSVAEAPPLTVAMPVGPRTPRIGRLRPDERMAHGAHIRGLGDGAIWLRFGLTPT